MKKIALLAVIFLSILGLSLLALRCANRSQAAAKKIARVGFNPSFRKIKGTIISIEPMKNEVTISCPPFKLYRTLTVDKKTIASLKIGDDIKAEVLYRGSETRNIQVIISKKNKKASIP